MSNHEAGPGGTPGEHAGAQRLRNLRTRLLSMAATYSDRRVTEELARADARKWHYAVLATLAEHGPASQAQLSDRTGIYRSDIVAVVNELTARQQVERSPNPADRRQNVITLTQRGHRQLITLDETLRQVEDEILAPLSHSEREQLTRLLTTLVDRHGQHQRPPSPSTR